MSSPKNSANQLNDLATLTSRASRLPNKQDRLIAFDPLLVIIALAGFTLALFHLDHAPLWHDEVFSAQWIRLSWMEMMRTVTSDNHLPLYPAMLKLWSIVAGESALALRLPSALLHALAILAIGSLACHLNRVSTARIAAVLTMLSPYLLHHAQEARMYPLILLLSTLSMLLMVRFLRQPESKPLGVLFIVLNLSLLLTHYYSLFFVAGQLLALGLAWRTPLRGWLPAATACIVMMALLTAFALFAPSLTAGRSYGIGLLAFPGIVWSMIGGYTMLPSSEELHFNGTRAIYPYIPFAVALAPVVLALGVLVIRRLRIDDWIIFGSVFLCVFLGPFFAHLVIPSISVNPRYFVTAAPLLLVFLAIGVGTNRLGKLLGVVLLGFMGYSSATHLHEPGHGRADVWAAQAWLDAEIPIDQPIPVSSPEIADLLMFHWPDRPLKMYPARNIVATADNVQKLVDELPAGITERTTEHFYYILGRIWVSDPDGLLRAELERRFSGCGKSSVRGIEIWCLVPSQDG